MKQTHTPQHYLSTLLPYLGALPFIIANVLLVTGGTSLPPLGEVVHIITVYGLIISVIYVRSTLGAALTYSPALECTTYFAE